MDSLKLISWPQDKDKSELIGGKAAALAAMVSTPVNSMIPPWFALTKNAFISAKNVLAQTEPGHSAPLILNKNVKEALDIAVKQLISQAGPDVLLAVRSSAIGEDGINASYAGQLKSLLNVSPLNIDGAIEEVWQSSIAQHIHTYEQSLNQETFKENPSLIPAVLIQVMVPARVAGVVFSQDPVDTSSQNIVISACTGLGEALVSGLVDGDTYYCNSSGAVTSKICESAPLLSELELQEICQLAKTLEAHFEIPQDIEWAYGGNTLKLLQSRPITTLNKVDCLPTYSQGEDTGNNKILWDNSNIVESYSGVTFPLTFSFARYIYENVYTEFCHFMGVSNKIIAKKHNLFRNMLGNINGHIYYNLLNWYEWLTLFPGFALNRRFMEQMMGVEESLPDQFIKQLTIPATNFWNKTAAMLRVSRSTLGLIYNAVVLKRKIKIFNKRLDHALRIPVSDLERMPLDQLCAHYRGLEEQLLRRWDAPLINDFLCMMAFGISQKLLVKHGGEKGRSYHRDMLIGQGDIISAEPAIRIRDLAEAASKHRELTATLCTGQKEACWIMLQKYPEIESKIKSYLDKFGDRCLQELKLESATIKDEPSTFFSSIGHLATRIREGKIEAKPAAVLPPLHEIIGNGWLRNQMIRGVCNWTKFLVSNRENLRFERTRLFGRVRQVFLNMGTHFSKIGFLNEKRDIFYLEVNEILGLIEGTATFTDIRSLVSIRKQEYSRLRELPAPPSRLITEGAVFANFSALSTDTNTRPIEIPSEFSLQGIACCQGIVQAYVRVITDPRNAELKAGEIMVAQFTDPGWITLFANAAGILIERGSLLSHSAIVARELNIPAIVGLKNIMQLLKTGDLVEMNGGTGTVIKIETATQPENASV